ncbi:MAG: hypothetical protein IIY43_07335 [Oscillospiraceae bacterium]|nr:hypothetical protein [Oscillospiraceae bacterium]
MDNTSKRTASSAEAVLSFLRIQGILAENSKLSEEMIRKAQDKKQKQAYHNTLLLLSNYRNILWQTDCEIEAIASELNVPLKNLDALLSRVDAEIGMENRRLELNLERLAKTRQLLDRINDALTALKRKPDNGPLLYELIYMTYISDEKLLQTDVLFRLNISRRHYYRLKEQAINIISLRLWSSPTSDLDLWLELVAMLSGGDK